MRKSAIGVGAVVVAVGVGYWTLGRPRTTTAPSAANSLRGVNLQQRQEGPRPVTWPDYSDPIVFAELIDRMRGKAIELERQWKSLPHVQTRLNEQLDAKGNPTSSERTVENVWHENDVEKRSLVGWFDVLAGSPKDPKRSSLPKVEKSTLIYPFADSKAEPQYRYSLSGYAKYGTTWAVEIAFEPTEPVADKLRGVYAFDPTAGVPLRMTATMAKLPALVESLTMIAEYGLSDNGIWQLSRWLSDGRGGLAFVRKHYRVETRYEKYVTPK